MILRKVHAEAEMYLMYVDESGDPGLTGSPTRYFILSGLVVHESRWRDLQDTLLNFRRTLKTVYSLPIRTEIHAAPYLRSAPIPGMKRHQRLAILRHMLDELIKLDYISLNHVMIDKQGKPASLDVFETAWKFMFQRFENTIRYGNYPGNHKNSNGIIFVDNTDGEKLNKLMRKMNVTNPIPSLGGGGFRNLPVLKIIEDPNIRDSGASLCIQAVDVCSYFLQQRYNPNSYIRKSGATHYFDRLDPVLNKYASQSNNQGIVIY